MPRRPRDPGDLFADVVVLLGEVPHAVIVDKLRRAWPHDPDALIGMLRLLSKHLIRTQPGKAACLDVVIGLLDG